MAKINQPAVNLTMRLFGMPYQFTSQVDPRLYAVSPDIGKSYVENILYEAPVCTFIPGTPEYMPGIKDADKESLTYALLNATESAGTEMKDVWGKSIENFFEGVEKVKGKKTKLIGKSNDKIKLFDFKTAYTAYMKYVNAICRAGAIFLNLQDTTDGLCPGVSSKNANNASFASFDWKLYRWNKKATTSVISKIQNMSKELKMPKFDGESGNDSDEGDGDMSQIMNSYRYVQFYVDPDVTAADDISNSTGESSLQQLFDQGTSSINEIKFIADASGASSSQLGKFAKSATKAFTKGATQILGKQKGFINDLLNLSGQVFTGNHLILPEIYQNSAYNKSYDITVHLRTPYGTKLAYYLDIFVPMVHLLCLALPKQASANSYASPFLVKAYIPAVFSCNLGIVDGLRITKDPESFNVHGLPTAVDVSLSIKDLYSDLGMSDSTSASLFASNTALIEFIAINCGIDLTSPNLVKKWENFINMSVNSITDVPTNVKAALEGSVYEALHDVLYLY